MDASTSRSNITARHAKESLGCSRVRLRCDCRASHAGIALPLFGATEKTCRAAIKTCSIRFYKGLSCCLCNFPSLSFRRICACRPGSMALSSLALSFDSAMRWRAARWASSFVAFCSGVITSIRRKCSAKQVHSCWRPLGAWSSGNDVSAVAFRC